MSKNAPKPLIVDVKREKITRELTIKIIKHNLLVRSGRAWSVRGGRGTAYGWITVASSADHVTEADAVELSRLMGLSRPVHCQGLQIPAGHDYWQEYVQRSAGRTPTVRGQQYWD